MNQNYDKFQNWLSAPISNIDPSTKIAFFNGINFVLAGDKKITAETQNTKSTLEQDFHNQFATNLDLSIAMDIYFEISRYRKTIAKLTKAKMVITCILNMLDSELRARKLDRNDLADREGNYILAIRDWEPKYKN